MRTAAFGNGDRAILGSCLRLTNQCRGSFPRAGSEAALNWITLRSYYYIWFQFFSFLKFIKFYLIHYGTWLLGLHWNLSSSTTDLDFQTGMNMRGTWGTEFGVYNRKYRSRNNVRLGSGIRCYHQPSLTFSWGPSDDPVQWLQNTEGLALVGLFMEGTTLTCLETYSDTKKKNPDPVLRSGRNPDPWKDASVTMVSTDHRYFSFSFLSDGSVWGPQSTLFGNRSKVELDAST